MGVEAIGVVVKRNRLRWFGHVERKDDCEGLHCLGSGGAEIMKQTKENVDGSCKKGHARYGS